MTAAQLPETLFEKRLRTAENGDRLLVAEGDIETRTLRTHPRGVVFRGTDGIVLNEGQLLPITGGIHHSQQNWRVHPRGIVVQQDQELWLNGDELLYGGNFADWRTHPKGVVIKKCAVDRSVSLLLNGTSVLHEGEPTAWDVLEDGTLAVHQGKMIFVNGACVMEDPNILALKSFERGFVVQTCDGLFLNGQRPPIANPAVAQRGRTLDVSAWLPHERGFMMEDPLQGIVLNGSQPLYKGPRIWWQPHPLGVLFAVRGQENVKMTSVYLSVLFKDGTEQPTISAEDFDPDAVVC